MKKVIRTLVGLESEVHVFFAREVPAELKHKGACMLLATLGCLYGEGSRHSILGKCCSHANVFCGGHEFLPCGGRVYWDHGFHEYATPACANTLEAVAAVRAGDLMMQQSSVELCNELEEENAQSLLAVRNNIDYSGHSYAAHVNVRMSRRGWDRIFENESIRNGFVVPFFLSLPIIYGSGRCGSEKNEDIYQIWQRADFIRDKNLISRETMAPNRPLLNSRYEPLANDPEMARFHVIAFDANRMDVAEYLKFGLLRLLCAAVDADCCNLNLQLDNPFVAVGAISRNPFNPVEMVGKAAAPMTAVEIQRAFFGSFERLCERGVFSESVSDAPGILARWDKVLTALEKDSLGLLIGKIDWVTKFSWLEQIRHARGLDWNSPTLRWLDMQYHCVAGGNPPDLPLEPLVDKHLIKTLTSEAPPNCRAAVRGELMRKFADSILFANWHYLVAADAKHVYLLPDDHKQDVSQALDGTKTLAEAAKVLGLSCAHIEQLDKNEI